MRITEVDEDGKPKKAHELPFKLSMMLPAFRGIAALRGIEGLANPRGFIIVDKHQRNPKFRNIFGVGVCIAIAPHEIEARRDVVLRADLRDVGVLAIRTNEQSPNGVNGLSTLLVASEQVTPCFTSRCAGATPRGMS